MVYSSKTQPVTPSDCRAVTLADAIAVFLVKTKLISSQLVFKQPRHNGRGRRKFPEYRLVRFICGKLAWKIRILSYMCALVCVCVCVYLHICV